MMDELPKNLNQVSHALDQSAAEHRDAGDNEKAEADKKLADSFGVAAERIGNIVRRIEERIQANRERQKMIGVDFYKAWWAFPQQWKDKGSPNFNIYLFQLLLKADNHNFRMISEKYPLEAKMVELWKTGNYSETMDGFIQIEKDARASFEEQT